MRRYSTRIAQKIVGMSHKPLWIAVPDVVANREATIKSWWQHYERCELCVHAWHLSFRTE